jgi:hypothetical protein
MADYLKLGSSWGRYNRGAIDVEKKLNVIGFDVSRIAHPMSDVSPGWNAMERQKYCVYNQNSECFLTLGASLADDALGYLGQLFRNRRPKSSDEGQWVMQPKPIHTLRFFSSRDLVILDAKLNVLQVIESWPSLRFVGLRDDAASMLALPVHTIYSSQTQPGHQLIICVPQEMKERLRTSPVLEGGRDNRLPDPLSSSESNSLPHAPYPGLNHRQADEPRLVAYNAKDSGLIMYSVREASAKGLFLATEERWPVGTQVTLTLQRMDAASDSLLPPINVEMCVARTGDDGMGLTFVRPGALEPLLTETIGR